MKEKIKMLRLVEKFCVPKSRETRYALRRPYRYGCDVNYVYATDTHIMIRVIANILPDDIGEAEGAKPDPRYVIEDARTGFIDGGIIARKTGTYLACQTCKGKRKHQQNNKDCEKCHGTGKIVCSECGVDRTCFDCYFRFVECEDCDNSGRYMERGKPLELSAITVNKVTRYCREKHIDLALEACGNDAKIGLCSSYNTAVCVNGDESVIVVFMMVDTDKIVKMPTEEAATCREK